MGYFTVHDPSIRGNKLRGSPVVSSRRTACRASERASEGAHRTFVRTRRWIDDFPMRRGSSSTFARVVRGVRVGRTRGWLDGCPARWLENHALVAARAKTKIDSFSGVFFWCILRVVNRGVVRGSKVENTQPDRREGSGFAPRKRLGCMSRCMDGETDD